MSLKKQAISGMLWTFAEQFGSRLISFVISIILARLLQPSDFGVIALFGVVMGIAASIVDGGLANSLVRTKDTDQRDYSTVFIFNIIASLFLYVIIYFLAPFIAEFYELDALTGIIRVYCIILIINAFVTVQRIQFVKDLNFKTAFKIQLPSLIIGGCCGVLLAYYGFGVWSLVYSALLQSCVFALQHWFYSSWRPKLLFDKEKFKIHFSFGYKMTLSGILNIVFENLYTIIIGKKFSIQELGYYNRADSLKQMPVSNLSTALNKVTFPLFAKISHDDIKLKEVYKKLMKIVIFIIAPVLAFMVVMAEPLIRLLLTDKWLPAVPYFQILSIAGLLYPIHAYNLNILQIKGRADLFLRLEVIKKIIIILIVVLAIKFGIFGLLWGQVAISVIALFINTHYTGKMLNYSGWNQVLDLLPSIILAFTLGGLIVVVDQYLLINLIDLMRILLSGLLYITLYLGIAYILQFKEIQIIKELLKK